MTSRKSGHPRESGDPGKGGIFYPTGGDNRTAKQQMTGFPSPWPSPGGRREGLGSKMGFHEWPWDSGTGNHFPKRGTELAGSDGAALPLTKAT